MSKTVIDMIVDKRLLRRDDRFFDRMKLLRDIGAGSSGLDHLNDAAQMPAGAMEPLDDRRMCVVTMFVHAFTPLH